MTTTPDRRSAEADELLTLARRAATAYARPDLEERLAGVARDTTDGRARVLVVGGFKAGKTELVNAVLGGRALPAHPQFATTVATVCTHGTQRSAVLVAATDDGEVRRPVAPATLAGHLTEQDNEDNAAGWSHAEVSLPRAVLSGLRLVDSPGVGPLSAAAALPGADAVLLACDAGRELTAPELALVMTAVAAGATVVVVPTRTDLHPQWRRTAELDRAHLVEAGETLADVRVVPTSARLALLAAERRDPDDDTAASLLRESGVPELRRVLTDEIAGDRLRRRNHAVADEVIVACEQLAAAFRAERDALRDPEVAALAARDLETHRARAAALRSRAARWRQTLGDGTADLTSDIEYDLRDRLRSIVVDAEAALESTDPAKTWDQFSTWLHQQVSDAVATNALWAQERTRWLAERVAEHFAEDGSGVLPVVALSPDGGGALADPVAMLAAPDHEKVGVAGQLLIGMRGSYGGVLMIGLVTTVSGMALLNPFSVGAGLLLGSKTLVDERRRALKRRRSDAKTAVRRHVDDVVFQAGKNSRDMLRGVQRSLRDHFTETAEELERSIAATVQAARAVEADGVTRQKRLGDLAAEIDRLEKLLSRARTLRARVRSTTPAGAPSTPRPVPA